MIQQYQKPPEPKDARISLTTRIWFFATVMLAITAPGFSTPYRSGNPGHVIVALAILAGAGIGTAAIWGAFNRRDEKQLPPAAPKDLAELEERVANLEIIARYEHMLQAEKDKLDAQSKPQRKLSML